MKLFGLTFGKKRAAPVVRNAKPKTEQQLRMIMREAAFNANMRYLGDHPEELQEMGREVTRKMLGIQEKKLEEAVLEEAIASDPATKKLYLEKILKEKRLGGANWMDQYEEMMDFATRHGLAGGPQGQSQEGGVFGSIARGLERAMENPMFAQTAAMIMGQLMQGSGGGEGKVSSSIANHSRLATLARPDVAKEEEEEGEGTAGVPAARTPETPSGPADATATPPSQARYSSIRDEVELFIKALVTKLYDNEPAEKVALFAFTQMGSIYNKQIEAGEDTSKIVQVKNILFQEPEGILTMLRSLAYMTQNKEYMDVVEQLATEEGTKYLEDFCLARDRLLQEAAAQAQAKS